MIPFQQIAKELCLRFEDKPRKCEKRNESLIGSNDRIINVHDGTFCYYHVIQQFEDRDANKLGSAVPKAGVKIRDIQNLQFPPKRVKNKNELTITFPKNKILKYVDPSARGTQDWTFTFNYDIVVLPEKQDRIKNQLKRQKQQDLRRLQNQQMQSKMSDQYSKFSNPAQKIQEQDYDINQQREKNRIQREKTIHNQEQQKPFQQCFNEEYNKMPRKSLSQIVDLQYNILKIIGRFRMKCVEVVKFLVDALLSQKVVNKYRVGDSRNEFKYDKIYVKIGEKQLNIQFLNMAHVANIVAYVHEKEQNNMRVPLACFIKYRNYKCLCTCYQFDKNDDCEIVYGLQDVGTIKTNSIISEKLKLICKYLNLKPYQTEINRAKQPVYLDPSCRVYKIKKDEYGFQYITSLRQVFPVEVDLENNIDQRTLRMRPEYVSSKVHKQALSGGAFLYSIQDPEGQQEDVEVGKASYLLSHQHLPVFVQKLNNLDIMLIDSPSIAQALQSNGFNIRYIGKIAKLAYLPYIKELMQIQGIARSVKQLFRSQVKQFTESKFKTLYKPNPYRQDEITEQFKIFDIISKQVIIDFLNVIFSKTADSKIYWQNQIKPLCKKKYDIDIKGYPPEVCYGGLLHAILYHCGIQVKFDIGIKLFNSQSPFQPSDWVGYTIFSKVFDFPSFEIQQLAKKSAEYIQSNNIDAAIKSLNLQLAIQKALKSTEFDQHCTLPQQKIIIKLSKYIPIKTSKFTANHPSMLQYILNNVSEENYIKANNIAEFSLPSTHPLFINFYMAFSKIYDKKILYKSSAMIALRSLGAKHPQTCKLLTITDKDDIEGLKKAWIDCGQTSQQIILLATQKLEEIGKKNQCVQYCEKGINKFDPPNQKTYKALIALCMRSIKNCYAIRDLTYMLKCVSILQKTLQTFDPKNQELYYEMIQYTLKIKLEKHNHQNYLYKLILIIADKMLKDRYNSYVKSGQKPPATITQLRIIARDDDLFEKVQGEQKSAILQQIIHLSRQAKSHVHWLANTLSQVDICFSILNYNNDLFIKTQKILKDIDNEDFEEGMQSLELLAKLYGQELFHNALIVHTFVTDI